MKKIIASLLFVSLFPFSGLVGHAAESDSDSSKTKASSHTFFTDLTDDSEGVINLEELDEYTRNENEKDGLNASPDYIPIETISTVYQSPITTLGAGEWDLVGTDRIKSGNSKIVKSSGGDFMIEFKQDYAGPGFTWVYEIWEDDGIIGDDFLGRWTLANTGNYQSIKFSTRNIIDGDNKKAEIYVKKMTVPTRYASLYFYD